MPDSARREITSADPLLARQERRESAARTYPRRLPVALARGEGAMVYDTGGRGYVDCLAGAGALVLGHHHPVVVEAIERAMADRVPLSTLDLATPLKDEFTDALFDVLPPHLAAGRVQFCGPTGADAVEAAVKLVRTATRRAPMLAFGGAYHGMTQGALELSGAVAPKEPLGALSAGVHHLPFPARFRCPLGMGGSRSGDLCARLVRWALTDDHSGITRPAGLIMEAVQGEGGVLPAPAAFARAVRAATAEAGVPLIVDEIQTGLGRTGSMWASEALGVEPDVMVLSKAIGGGLPLAVIVYRAELDRWAPGAHAGTFRGNQLAMAAGAATIRHVAAEGLAERAAEMGDRLTQGLREASAGRPEVAEVRGPGLMVGVEIVDPDRPGSDGYPVPDGALAERIQRAMLEEGVLVELGGRGAGVVRFLPPLIISGRQVDEVVAAFARALATAGHARTRE